jgi:Uma2 family endonuclease
MQAAVRTELVNVEDYLVGEEASQLRHEYLAGVVYAMAGGTSDHHQIGLNIAFAARSHLKGKGCRVFVFDFKVRLGASGDDVFYYPDIMVGCDRRDTDKRYLRFPKLIVEIASDSTERVDRGEKKAAYQTIETLEEYVIVAQDRTEVTVFRRASGWRPEVLTQPDDSLSLNSIGLTIQLSGIYEGVSPPA